MPEDMDLGTFKIKIKTLEGVILVFRNVLCYDIDEGLITFTDSKTGIQKIFPTSSTEISLESDSR